LPADAPPSSAPATDVQEAVGKTDRAISKIRIVTDADVTTETIEVTFDGAKVLEYRLKAAGTGVEVHAKWYSPAVGASEGLFVVDGKTLSGTIDGRAFKADSVADSSDRWKFDDGGGAPGLQFPATVAAHGERALTEARRVFAAKAPRLRANSDGIGVAVAALQSNPDLGHFSIPGTEAPCNECRAACAGSGVLAGGACGFFTFGLGTVFCAAGALALVESCITVGCSHFCCPVQCSSSRCCSAGESCLNTGSGLCCSSGKRSCEGRQCCTDEQACISQGPNRGSCCDSASACGPSCCDSAEVCQNSGTGQCCRPDKVCGTACCGGANSPVDSFCANGARSLCCLAGETDCNGVCCGGNHECRNNQCSFKQTLDCGSMAACVDPSTGQPIPGFVCPGPRGVCGTTSGCCFHEPA
jgi:hypothetical protein